MRNERNVLGGKAQVWKAANLNGYSYANSWVWAVY